MGTDISFVIERKCKNCYIVIMFQFMAVCALGLEKVLGNEIKKAGWSIMESDSGRVFFQGPENVIYSGNLRLRTCDRIFLVPARFKARDFDQLFEGIRAVNWQDYFKKNTRIVIDKVRINYSKLNSQKAVQKVAHKAVYDKLCNLWGMNSLPESGEIDFLQGALVHVRAGMVAAPLLVVGRKVLDGGHDAFLLHADDVVLGRLAGQAPAGDRRGHGGLSLLPGQGGKSGGAVRLLRPR